MFPRQYRFVVQGHFRISVLRACNKTSALKLPDGLELRRAPVPGCGSLCSATSGARVRFHSLSARAQTKFAASFVSPVPLYLAICG